MRRYAALICVVALAACGGGQGANTVPSPGAPATASPTGPQPSAHLVTATFNIRVPARAGSTTVRRPKFVSSGTQSVSITLTADSAGINPLTIAGNPAITNISSGSCSSGCTISGPPSPPGSDTYTVTTFDAAGAGGNALDTNAGTFTLTSGAANNESLTLNGIPVTVTFGTFPPFVTIVGTSSGFGLGLTITDADGEAIVGTYATPVTVSDPDTNGDGTEIILGSAACPSRPIGNPPTAPTQISIPTSTVGGAFCYGGIAENPVTFSASIGGVTVATKLFRPNPSVPTFEGGSTNVIGTSPPEAELFTGSGSTATADFAETGWTEAPYNQKLLATPDVACTANGPFSSYATVTSANASDLVSTQFTLSTIASPSPGACPLTISDGLNDTIGRTLQLDTSYTTTSFGINGHIRRQR